MGQAVKAGHEQNIRELQTSLIESMVKSRPAQRGRHYWRNRVRRQRQHLLIKRLRESSFDLRHRPILRRAASPQRGDARIGSEEVCRIKEEIVVDGMNVGVVPTGEELREVVCHEQGVEVDDLDD